MNSPITWYGGKGLMRTKLLPLFPPHDKYRCYLEVFGGGASLLFAKNPSTLEIYNDTDSGLFNFMNVIRDKDVMFPEFYRRTLMTGL